MELHDHPVRDHRNKFVLTERQAYFLPVVSDEVPRFADILAEIFNLEDLEAGKALDEMLDGEKLIMGYLEADGGLDIHVPLERNEHVEERLREVFRG